MTKTTFSRMVEIGNLVSNLDEIEVTCDAWKTGDKDGQGQQLITIDMELFVWIGKDKDKKFLLTDLVNEFCPNQLEYFRQEAMEEMDEK